MKKGRIPLSALKGPSKITRQSVQKYEISDNVQVYCIKIFQFSFINVLSSNISQKETEQHLWPATPIATPASNPATSLSNIQCAPIRHQPTQSQSISSSVSMKPIDSTLNNGKRTNSPYSQELNSDEQGDLQSEDSLEAEKNSNIAFQANVKRSIDVKSVQPVGAVGKRAKVQADTSEVTSNQAQKMLQKEFTQLIRGNILLDQLFPNAQERKEFLQQFLQKDFLAPLADLLNEVQIRQLCEKVMDSQFGIARSALVSNCLKDIHLSQYYGIPVEELPGLLDRDQFMTVEAKPFHAPGFIAAVKSICKHAQIDGEFVTLPVLAAIAALIEMRLQKCSLKAHREEVVQWYNGHIEMLQNLAHAFEDQAQQQQLLEQGFMWVLWFYQDETDKKITDEEEKDTYKWRENRELGLLKDFM
ncbi:hypothetical protein MP228_003846 [Amoeboaphelidium protococcarum]|nr:hypothetical protein MP228_003846 [Amoeboaphelidium protococcarum]